ncbi:MAG TPA: transcriptional repressor LexA, partial [Ktedonobacteraceae bacterium]
MPSEQASEMQLRIYNFIAGYIREEGMAPTNREIGSAMRIASTGHVDYHLNLLEKKGLIAREPKKSRGIRLIENSRGIPVLGSIAAGEPLEVYSDPITALDIGGREFEGQGNYALVVRGQSMIEDHICDRDYVIIKPKSTCENGDIVVAVRWEGTGRATLKRFYMDRERNRVRLQPANSSMDPIFIPRTEWDQEWQVQGVVIALLRDWGGYGNKGFVQEQENVKLVENFEQENLGEADDLDLYAIARTTLEEDNTAFVNKTYTVQAGISQTKPENFGGEPFQLQVESATEPVVFDILIPKSENIEIITNWHQRLRYKPDNIEPQLIKFEFRVLAPGKALLVIDFYHERRWLRTIRFDFNALEQLQFASISLEE